MAQLTLPIYLTASIQTLLVNGRMAALGCFSRTKNEKSACH